MQQSPASSDAKPIGYLTGGLAVASARAIRQIAQFGIFLFGARILGPEEFGLFALVSVIAILAHQAALAGCHSFILSDRRSNEVVRQILTIAAFLGMLVATLGILTSAGLYAFYKDPAVPILVALFSIWILLAAYADAQAAILIRAERLMTNATCEILSELIGAVVTIWLLYINVGAPALIWGRIAAQGFQVAASSYLTGTLPAPRVSHELMSQLARFSAHILNARLLAHFRQALGSIVIGGFLGPVAVGYFRVAQRLTGSIYELTSDPFRSIGWIVFRQTSSRHDDLSSPEAKAEFQEKMEWLVPLLFALSAPIYAGIAITSEQLLFILLGEKWLPAAPVVSVLAIGMLLLIPAVLTEPLLGLTGRMRYMSWVAIFNTVVALLLVLPAAPFGILPIAFAQLASCVIAFCSTVWLQAGVIGLNWFRIGAKCLLLVPLLGGMIALAIFVQDGTLAHGVQPVTSLVLTALSAGTLYIAALTLMHTQTLPRLLRAIRRV